MSDFPVAALRSVEITTPHLAGSVDFYTGVWGLDVAAEADGTVYLAATGGDFHVLELTSGETTSPRKVS
ncbi:MAG: VOC family protein, partial [Bradyrhizobium guangdongense]